MDMETLIEYVLLCFIEKNPLKLQQNSMFCGNEIKTTK
jgi:hypothetical protein